MLRRLLFLITLVAPLAVCAEPAVATAAHLVGAWRLVSIEMLRPNGEIIYPFYGRRPSGLIVYDASGWMSVQIVADPRPAVPTARSYAAFVDAPAAERAVAADGYYAYFGTFSVDAATTTVTHHLQESLHPGERGADYPRTFTIADGRLTLVATTQEMGETHQRRLT